MSKAKKVRVVKAHETKQTAWGLPIYVVGDRNEEWAVGTAEQAHDAAKIAIYENLYNFDPEFLVMHLPSIHFDRKIIDRVTIRRAIENVQKHLISEQANQVIVAMYPNIHDLLRVVEDAIKAYGGPGYFIARYDGEERRSESVPGLPKGLFAYRQN